MRALDTIVAVALVPSVAVAQPTEGKVDAKALNASGVKLLEAKDYLGALAVFKDAYARFHSAKILLNVGTTLKLLDRKADAANAYQQFLDSADSDPAKRAEVVAALAELDRSVALLDVTVTPAEAEVRIGGDWLPSATVKLWRVEAGEYKVETRRDGYQLDAKGGHIAVGERVEVVIAMALIPKPAAAIVTVPSDARLETTVVPEGPRSRVGLLALAHVEVIHGGAAAFVGLTADVLPRLQLQGAAILGPSYGGYVGAAFAILDGQVRPLITAGLPIFDSHGARYALRGAGGVEVELSRHLALIVEVGVEYNLNPDMGIKSTAFVPAIGVAGRL